MIEAELTRSVASWYPGATGVTGAAKLSGGASQETWSFDIVHPDGNVGSILRRAPPGYGASPSRAAGLDAEATLMQLAHEAGVPSPRVMHVLKPEDELGRGFISNGQSSTVTIFDLKTLKAISEVSTGQKPDAIIYDPATSRVFAFNGGSNSATAIQAADGKVAGTVDLGGGPEFAAADGSGSVYDNLEDESLVLKINSRLLKVEQRWPTAPCASPSSMAMDRPNRRLFIGCRSKVMAVMNADTGQVITTLPIGDHVDATAFDPDSRLIFNSNGEGTITVIHQDSPDKYSVVENVKTLPRAKTMALDPKTHQLFLSTAEAGQFEVLIVGR